jgi:hypothetical protein
MKRELKGRHIGFFKDRVAVADLIPMKRELKERVLFLSFFSFCLVADLIPMKRELKNITSAACGLPILLQTLPRAVCIRMKPRPHAAQPERTLSGALAESKGKSKAILLTLRLRRSRCAVYPELAEEFRMSGSEGLRAGGKPARIHPRESRYKHP